MQNKTNLIKIDLTPEFYKNLKSLAKKYRNIRSDIQSYINDLQRGIFSGDRLSGFGENEFIYKLRINNSNVKKGKSAGYRLIYLLESKTSILLLTIYSKSEQQDISINDIQSILEKFYDN